MNPDILLICAAALFLMTLVGASWGLVFVYWKSVISGEKYGVGVFPSLLVTALACTVTLVMVAAALDFLGAR